MNGAVGRCLPVLVDDYLPNVAGNGDAAARGILDARDVALDACPDRAVLQHQVGIGAEGAVHQREVLAVAQRLLAGDVATHECKATAVPCQVLAVDLAVRNGDVLAVPKRILAVQERVLYLHIAAVLKAIVAFEVKVVDADIVGVHAKIIGILNQAVLDVNPVAVPQSFLRIGEVAVLQLDSLHAAEHLRRIDMAADEPSVLAIPERRTCRSVETAVPGKELATFPEDILALERTIVCLDVATFLNAGLANVYRHTLQTCIVQGVERPFATKFLILDFNHLPYYIYNPSPERGRDVVEVSLPLTFYI